jgi:zinc/manganese transport system ATP-binding protein
VLGMSSNPTGTVGIPPERGAVEVGGREVPLALQRSQVGDTFPITVAEAVAMGRWRRLGLLRRPSRTDRDIVSCWIAELGLDELAHRRLGDLQRQRVLLPRPLLSRHRFVLLDEPTTGLDADATDRVTQRRAGWRLPVRRSWRQPTTSTSPAGSTIACC